MNEDWWVFMKPFVTWIDRLINENSFLGFLDQNTSRWIALN